MPRPEIPVSVTPMLRSTARQWLIKTKLGFLKITTQRYKLLTLHGSKLACGARAGLSVGTGTQDLYSDDGTILRELLFYLLIMESVTSSGMRMEVLGSKVQ